MHTFFVVLGAFGSIASIASLVKSIIKEKHNR